MADVPIQVGNRYIVMTVLKFNPLQDTKTMTKTIVHLMQGDVPGLVDDAIELGFLPEDVDKVGNDIAQCSHLLLIFSTGHADPSAAASV